MEARRQDADSSNVIDKSSSGQFSLPLHFRNEIMTNVNLAIGHVLDAMTNPDEMCEARNEAKGAITASVKALKEVLKKPGLDNEQKAAQIRKLTAEAESIEVQSEGERIRNEEQQL